MKTAKYFTASWCPQCKMLKPVILELVSEGHQIEIFDVDDHVDLASDHGIMSVPTVLIYEPPGYGMENLIDAIYGVVSKDELLHRLKA